MSTYLVWHWQDTRRSFTRLHKWPVTCQRPLPTYPDDQPSQLQAVATSSCHGPIGIFETEHSASQLLERGIDCHRTWDSCVRRRHSGAISRHLCSLLLSSDKQTFMDYVMRRRSTCRRRMRNVVTATVIVIARYPQLFLRIIPFKIIADHEKLIYSLFNSLRISK